MKRTALAVLAFGALAVVPTPASADHYQGGCSFASNNDPSGEVLNPDTQTGAIVATVVGGTTVNCWIAVNGAQATPTATFTGTNGVVAGAQEVTYTAPEGSITTLCEQVDGDAVVCGQADEFEFPPDEFYDLLDTLFIDVIDPAICPVLDDFFPGGDIPEAGWECPPYSS